MTTTPGAWLRDQIDAAGMTPAQLARHLGVSETRVYSWLRGAGKPGDDNARKIADILETSETEVRLRLGMYVQREAIQLEGARRRVEILRDAARTKREREAFDEITRALKGEQVD